MVIFQGEPGLASPPRVFVHLFQKWISVD